MTSTQAGPAGHDAGDGTDLVPAGIEMLLAAQDGQGRWRGDADAGLPAEAMLVREYLGTGRANVSEAAADRLRAAQQPDGRWPGGTAPGDDGDLTASVLSYLALRLAGDSPDSYHLAIAAGWIRDAGGLEATGPVGTAWLAAFGLTEWAQVHVPVLDIRARRSSHASVAGLSRLAAVTLSVLSSVRPVRHQPLTLTELQTGPGPVTPPASRPLAGPVQAAHRAVARRGGQWLIDWQQRDGIPVASRPAWPLALIALAELGYPLRHPVLSAGLIWLDTVTGAGQAATDSELVRAGVLPPVAATARAALALTEAGLPPASRALTAAASWLLAQRIDGPAERPWRQPAAAIRGPAAANLTRSPVPPSGWSFGLDGYPAPADTAEVLLTLGSVELSQTTDQQAVRAALDWLITTPDHDGSWARSVPVTATVVRALCAHGRGDDAVFRRGVVWLLRAQQADGSWAGGRDGQLRATALALTALVAAGVLTGKPSVRAAASWLTRQAAGDGWPADARAGRSRRASSPDAATTALAVIALLAAGVEPAPHAIGAPAAATVGRAADWLAATQRPGAQSPAGLLALAAAGRLGRAGTSATS